MPCDALDRAKNGAKQDEYDHARIAVALHVCSVKTGDADGIAVDIVSGNDPKNSDKDEGCNEEDNEQWTENTRNRSKTKKNKGRKGQAKILVMPCEGNTTSNHIQKYLRMQNVRL